MPGSPSLPERGTCGWIGLVLAALVPLPALGQGLPIAPGDVLRIAVTGAPEMGREAAKVSADGRIVLPGLDAIEVGGGDLSAARRRIEAALVARDILKEPTVLVEVASYRPFYVGGAVARPGAVPYEPGLTVRHALILAGGPDRSDGPDRLSAAALVELKARHGASAQALVEVRSRIARLEAELAQAAAPDFSKAAAPRAPEAGAKAIVSLDGALFRDETAAFAADQDHRRDVARLIDLEIDVLSRQADLQAQEREIQSDQVDAARALVEKGVMPLPRLQELQRETSRLSRDMLDNQAYAARARQNRQANLYEIDAAEVRRRLELRAALRAAALDLTEAEAKNEALSVALVAAGVSPAGGGLGAAPEPRVVVNRMAGGRVETIAAGPDMPILPGDVLEVAFPTAGEGGEG